MAEPQTTLLSASGIEKRFGALTVLAGVDFKLGAGESVGMVGPNGAGKTTLLNILSGSTSPNSGRVEFEGLDVTRRGAAARCRLGIGRAHQIPRPFGGMTVFENVFVGATAGAGKRGREAYARVADVLVQCRIEELANRRADSLGLLHRKRLEMARALATGPRVLLLDEIGAGLTDAEATELVQTIAELRAAGVAIVWIEHVVHVLLQAIDRLVCLDGGRVIADGDPQTVMKSAAVIDAYLGSSAA